MMPIAAILLTPVWPCRNGSGRSLRAWSWVRTLAQEGAVQVIVAGGASAASPDAGTQDVAASWVELPTRPQARRLARSVQVFPPLGWFHRPAIPGWARPVRGSDPAWLELQATTYLQTVRLVVFRLQIHDVGEAVIDRLARDGGPRIDAELDLDDDEAATQASIARAEWRAGRWRHAWRRGVEGCLLAGVQRWCSGPYRCVWLAAAEDAESVKTRLAPVVGVHPNRLPADHFLRLTAEDVSMDSGRTQLLFVGSLDYTPNHEAVEFLLDQVLPRLKAMDIGAFELAIVGRRAAPALEKRLHAEPLIAYYPDVADVRPLYRSAWLALVPLFAGGGSKFKTIEALLAGCPLIATAHGVRGLSLTPGEHYRWAETPDDFAHAIATLLRAPADRRLMARAGHQWAQQYGCQA